LRTSPCGRSCVRAIAIVVSTLAALSAPASAEHGTGGAGTVLPPAPAPPAVPPTTALETAELSPDGRTAIAPVSAPDEVKNAISAANQLTRKPYRYGGGHRSFLLDTAYDCSGAVSYALHGAGLLDKPLDSSGLMRWGLRGKGAWITVYTNPRHVFAVLAGLRFDTSGPGQRGPRWRSGARVSRGFAARHPDGL
jgi:hypothetical protein